MSLNFRSDKNGKVNMLISYYKQDDFSYEFSEIIFDEVL